MYTRKSASVPLLALAGLMAVAAIQSPVDAKRSEDVELLIITSASNRGEYDPCG